MEEEPPLKRIKVGRPAILTRAQVEEIKDSVQPIDVLMLRYSVSRATICRARHAKYVTAEEKGAHSSSGVGRGRRLMSNGKRLDHEDKLKIAADPREAREVADAFGVSLAYVYKLRVLHGGRQHNSMLPHEVMQHILTSKQSSDVLATKLHIPKLVIEAARRVYGKE